jgi:hypothetical protein
LIQFQAYPAVTFAQWLIFFGGGFVFKWQRRKGRRWGQQGLKTEGRNEKIGHRAAKRAYREKIKL